MGIETWFEKSKQILYDFYIIYIQGPFPCKAISKIDWKTAKLWVLVHILFYLQKKIDLEMKEKENALNYCILQGPFHYLCWGNAQG